ncbi:kinetochore-associated protein KNL-2 homolog [Impatiens glandulifera]|uniref:kinetochore-associated protein KNL-2 homolog n=1 Tax=Impatiens glandulifera TaxID=253017 RepID=UPI001FB0836D|nr:kinetochore-associated protein KNL-2 homolog [Impatiens glandulifera]
MASITPPSRPIGHNDASTSYFVKTVCLQNWWLIKAENEFDGRRLGIAGQTSREHQAVREFKSAPILKRHDIFTLETVDGVFILMEGFINEDRTKENGFPPEVFNHFVFGFPPLWEEYAKKWCGKEPTDEDASMNQSLGRISTDPGEIHSHEDASEKSTSSFREGDIFRSQDNLVDSSTLAVNPSDAEVHSLEDASEKSTSSFREGDISRSQDNLVDSSTLAVNPSDAEIHSLEDASEKSTFSFREGDISRSQENLVDSSTLAVNPSDAEIHSLEDASEKSTFSFREGDISRSQENSVDSSTLAANPSDAEIHSLEDASEKSTSSFREGDISRSQDNLGDSSTLAVNLSISAGAEHGSLQELSPGKKTLEENTFMSNSPNRTLEIENTNDSSPIVAEKELPGSLEQVDNHKQTSLTTHTTSKKKKVTVKSSNSKRVKLCASTRSRSSRTLEVENTTYSSPIVAEKELPGSPEQTGNHKQTSLTTNTMSKKKKVTVKSSNSKCAKLCASTRSRTLEVENTNYSSPIVAEKELPGSPEHVDNHEQTSLTTNTMSKKKKLTVKSSNSKRVKLCTSTGQQARPVTRASTRKDVLVAEASCLPKNNSKINGTVRSSVRFAVAEGNVDSDTVVNKTVKHATNSTRSLKKTKRKLQYESPHTPKRTLVSPGSSSPKRSRSGRQVKTFIRRRRIALTPLKWSTI